MDRADPRPRRRCVVDRETIRLAFVAALQHLPPRQRAVLILCEVLRWQASEVAELLETSVASVNSALQRARATLETADVSVETRPPPSWRRAERELLARYVEAFEAYDIERLTALIHEDATQSMPPFDLWLTGRDDIFTWWFGPGIGCKGSRVIPAGPRTARPPSASTSRAEDGGYEPWALQVLELRDGRIGEMTFFLDTARLFPLFGLPLAARVLARRRARRSRRRGRGAPRSRTPRNRAPRAQPREQVERRQGRQRGPRVDVDDERLRLGSEGIEDKTLNDRETHRAGAADEFRRGVRSNR